MKKLCLIIASLAWCLAAYGVEGVPVLDRYADLWGKTGIEKVNTAFDLINAGKAENYGGGDTATRTALTPSLVGIYANTETGKIDFWNGASWVSAGLDGAEIKALYEANANTNAFTDALLAKLNGIALGAGVNTDDQTLSLIGDTLTLEDGGSVDLSSYAGGGASNPLNDLAGGTSLSVANDYFDDFSGSRTLTFSGPPSGGDSIRLSANVTASSVILTVPTSYRLGTTGTTTSVTLSQGSNELSWIYADSKWWLADTGTGVLPDDSVGTSQLQDDAVTVAKLSAVGTASSATYLRGDGSWQTPVGGGGGSTATVGDVMPTFSTAGFYGSRDNGDFRYYETANSYWDLAAGTYTDGDAPTLNSATIASDGVSLTLAFSEVVSIGVGSSGGIDVDGAASGADIAGTYSSGDGTSALVFTLGNAVLDTDTLTLDYAQPGNGLEDGSGNDLASVVDAVVTNGSAQTASSAVSPGTANLIAAYDFDNTIAGEGDDDAHASYDLTENGSSIWSTGGPNTYEGLTGSDYLSSAALAANWASSDQDWSVVARVRDTEVNRNFYSGGGTRDTMGWTGTVWRAKIGAGVFATVDPVADYSGQYVTVIAEYDSVETRSYIYFLNENQEDSQLSSSDFNTSEARIGGTIGSGGEMDYIFFFNRRLSENERRFFGDNSSEPLESSDL